MIQAQELRIGNNAIVGTSVVIIHRVSQSEVVVDFGEDAEYEILTPDDLSPIAITPEILEACGFKKWDKNEQSGITRYTRTHSMSKDFLIYLYGDGNIEFCIDCDEFSKVLNEVYSLHQLQNLYFSLTGKELTYSPNTTVK